MTKKNYKALCIFICLYIASLFQYMLCKDIKNQKINNINDVLLYSTYPKQSNIDDIEGIDNINDCSISEEISTIKIGSVQTELLHKQKKYTFNFDNFNVDNDIVVNFYSIDCLIEIYARDVNIIKINNQTFDSFTARIPKDKISTTRFEICPIISSDSTFDYDKNRTYHLIINSFEKKDYEYSELLLKEKEPTFLLFDNNLTKIKVSFNLKERMNETMYFSFFIKEKVKFNIKETNGIINDKNISYIDNIIITPEQLSVIDKYPYKISLSINKYDESKNATMIIRVVSNYSYPSYLPKNMIYFGFTPNNNMQKQFFYLEVFDREEGEIILNNKKINGKLFSKIIKKSDYNINQYVQNDKKKNKDMLLFNEYSQKLKFNNSKTKFCSNGCYLLLTYIPEQLYTGNIIGTEFSLSCRIWNTDNYIPNKINIPLNEYIYGSFEEDTSIIHSYTIFIPDDGDVFIEILANNVKGYAKEEIIKKKEIIEEEEIFEEEEIIEEKEIIIEENAAHFAKDNYYIQKSIISLNKTDLKIDSFDNKYISFYFNQESDFSKFSNYYFRILQKNTNYDYLIYPLDTNKENLCQPLILNNILYACYFLLKNDYNDLSTNHSIYIDGDEEAIYSLYKLKQDDYYSFDVNQIIKKDKIKLIEPLIPESDTYLLLEITSKSDQILKVYCDFTGNLTSPSLTIYSSQLFYFNSGQTKDFSFNYNIKRKYNIIINTMNGKGKIYFKDKDGKKLNENDNTISEQMYDSFIVSSNSEKESIYFLSEENFFFRMKINYINQDETFKKIYFGLNKIENINSIDLVNKYFYLKLEGSEEIDINFKLNFINNTKDYFSFFCEGMIVNYNVLKSMVTSGIHKEMFLPQNRVKGQYDSITKSGFIKLKEEFIRDNFNENKDDNYLMFFIRDTYHRLEYSNISIEIFADSKNSFNFLPKNKYIRGSFENELNKVHEHNYYIDHYINHDKKQKQYILEFGSNSPYIDLKFNDCIYKKDENNNELGFHKYFISLSNCSDCAYFTVRINNDNQQSLEEFNYILRLNEKFENNDIEDNILDKNITIEYLTDEDGKNIEFNIILKNKKIQSQPNKNIEYIYYLRYYLKDNLINNENLNTIAMINTSYETKISSDIVGPDKEISFNLSNLEINKKYKATFFIIVKKNNIDNYYSRLYEFETNKKTSPNDSSKTPNRFSSLIIASICITIIIALFIMFVLIYQKIWKKNKKLVEKIQTISFSQGVEDSFEDEEIIKKDENDIPFI